MWTDLEDNSPDLNPLEYIWARLQVSVLSPLVLRTEQGFSNARRMKITRNIELTVEIFAEILEINT